jgi:predicted ATPase
LALPTALNPERRFRVEGNGFGLPTLIDDLLNYDRDNFAALEREFIQIFPQVRAISLVQQQGFNSPVDQSEETLALQPSAGKQVVFRLKNTDRDLPASQAAEGMLYILGYLALMYLPHPPRVLLIEEPENGIHPNRVGDIVRILRRLVERHPQTQIVMSTHSPYLVDAFMPEEVTWCRRNAVGEVVLTRLDNLPEVERSMRVFSLGEIWTGELEPLSPSEVND